MRVTQNDSQCTVAKRMATTISPLDGQRTWSKPAPGLLCLGFAYR
jgi:hypothetical protein